MTAKTKAKRKSKAKPQKKIVIVYGQSTLTDVDPALSLKQIKSLMGQHFAELANNPKVETAKVAKTNTTTFTFSKRATHKG